jgi:hypothetical protein
MPQGVTLTLLAMLGVAPAELDYPDADEAMARFVAAVRRCDRRRVHALLSRSGRVHHLDTLARPFRRSALEGSDVSGLDGLIFGDDGFRDCVMMGGRRAWPRKSPLLYVPPYATSHPIHVRWRRRREQLVIEEIALPSG